MDTETQDVTATGTEVVETQTPEATEPAEEATATEAKTEGSTEADTTTDSKPPEVAKKNREHAQDRIERKMSRIRELELENAYLKGKTEATGGKPAEIVPEGERERRSAEAQFDALHPEPQEDNFENHKDYVKAIANREWEKRDYVKESTTRVNTVSQAQQEVVTKVRNYVDRAIELSGQPKEEFLEDFFAVTVTPDMTEAINDSEKASEIILYLKDNPAEGTRISNLKPALQGRAIAQIEAKVAIAAPKAQETKATTTTKAPPPPATVGGKGGVSVDIYDPSVPSEDRIRHNLAQKGIYVN